MIDAATGQPASPTRLYVAVLNSKQRALVRLEAHVTRGRSAGVPARRRWRRSQGSGIACSVPNSTGWFAPASGGTPSRWRRTRNRRGCSSRPRGRSSSPSGERVERRVKLGGRVLHLPAKRNKPQTTRRLCGGSPRGRAGLRALSETPGRLLAFGRGEAPVPR